MGSSPRQNFKKKVLATSIAALASVSYSAFAQDAAPVEEVLVTGMRAALEQAMDIKRESSGVVDAISAEDMGKFPDTNLAESLQRITGVSINRANGEGSQVTVRGFGADNNSVTLNGRTMPGSALSDDNVSNTRAYDFSNIASEGVTGVEVYKTGRASVASGGIGATINVKTHKPLDKPGLQAATSIKAAHDTTNVAGDDITPELAGLLSWTTDDERFGVSFVGAYQKRDSGDSSVVQNGWAAEAWDSESMPRRFNENTVITNRPAEGQLVSMPKNLSYDLSDYERTRVNGQLTFQYRPIESLTATLDYTYAGNATERHRKEQSVWMAAGVSAVTFDNNTIKTPVLYTETQLINAANTGQDLSFAHVVQYRKNENESIGFNLDWVVNDRLSLNLDVHDSSAESGPDHPTYGSESKFSTAAFVIKDQTLNFTQDIPTFDIVVDDSFLLSNNKNGLVDASDISPTRGAARLSETKTDIQQIRLDGSLDFDNGSIDFGIERREMENVSRYSQIDPVFGDWGGTDPALVNDEFFSPRDFAGELNGGFATGFEFDFDTLAKWAADTKAARPTDNNFRDFVGPNGTWSTDTDWHTNRKIAEDISSLYFQLNMEGELGGMATYLTTGLRYERTDVTSTSAVAPYTSIEWESDDDFLVNQGGAGEVQVEPGQYSNLLPSLDFSIDLAEDVKGRMSYSQTIARPVYDYIRGGVGSISYNNGNNPSASKGNPGLVPLESNNLDLSVEWYYSDSSYVSAGYFRKEVDNFVAVQPVVGNIDGLADPLNGDRAQKARRDLADEGNANPTAEQLFNRVLENDGLDPTDQSTSIVGDVSKGDPLVDFTINQPVNAKTATLHGMEFAVQHVFGDSGFGVIANYTFVDSDSNYDNNRLTTESDPQFALLGLSDTANLVAFYDKDGLQARIAYNWRNEFLSSTNSDGQQEPEYTDTFAQVDASVSYDFTDNVTVFFEGINLTGEDYRTHGRTDAQTLRYTDLGARFNVGARYIF